MFIDRMNRKQKRKFNKLSPEEQAPIIEAELIQKVSPIMAQQISKSMIAGMDLLYENLYKDFVEKIDNGGSEYGRSLDDLIGDLLSLIRTQYLRIQANKAKENKDETGAN